MKQRLGLALAIGVTCVACLLFCSHRKQWVRVDANVLKADVWYWVTINGTNMTIWQRK